MSRLIFSVCCAAVAQSRRGARVNSEIPAEK
jgi:hypothetical protein